MARRKYSFRKRLCKVCKKEYEGSANKLYCSKSCRQKHYWLQQDRSPSKLKACSFCYTKFLKIENKNYCNSGCETKFQDRRKAKNRKRNARKYYRYKSPKWANKQEISKIYENIPEGHQVDHIVPINSKEVCGLHVEYNLQYLSNEDNLLKSNQFDGTYNNTSWKSSKK